MSFRKNRSNKVRTLASKRDNIAPSKATEPLGPTSTVVPQNIAEDEVPAGTVPEVLSWVGEDPLRAQSALDKELEAEKPRKGLVSSLVDLIDSEAKDEDDGAEETDSH